MAIIKTSPNVPVISNNQAVNIPTSDPNVIRVDNDNVFVGQPAIINPPVSGNVPTPVIFTNTAGRKDYVITSSGLSGTGPFVYAPG